MILQIATVLSALAGVAHAQAAPCLAVEGDRVLARDLVSAVPAFGKIPPDTMLASAPLPGVRRVLRSYELVLLAKRYGIEAGDASDLCLERQMEALDRNRMLDTMRLVLALPDARIEIVETSLYQVPRGGFEFRREGLGTPALPDSPAPVIWRGNVVYGDNRRFAVWARVLISASISRVVATGNLKRGEPIQASQLRMESIEGFPSASDVAHDIVQVAGQVPLRDIPSGKEIHLALVTSAPDVARGDTVDVEVHSGGARVAFTGKAESSGRKGETIAIRNPSSNRVFQARVDGKKRAVLDAGNRREN